MYPLDFPGESVIYRSSDHERKHSLLTKRKSKAAHDKEWAREELNTRSRA